MRKTLRRLTLASMTVFLLQACAVGPAMAQTVLFAAPAWVKLANGSTTISTPALPWAVAQYSTPVPLPPFAGNLSRNDNAAVEFYPAAPPNPAMVRMRATSYQNECVNSQGIPIEQDLFLEGPPAVPPPVLTAVGGMVVDVNLQTKAFGPHDQLCMGKTPTGAQMFNSTELSIDFNIKDGVTGQTFSYGVVMGQFNAPDRTTALIAHLPRPSWFQKGPIAFGYDEPISDFVAQDGVPLQMLSQNVMTPYNFDVLHNIEAAIEAGAPYGMDSKLSDWKIIGLFFDLHAFGHTQITGWESGLQMVAK